MFLSKKKKFFVIAEIGHNHLGKLDVAYKMIEEAKRCGADAVKLQKRDNKSLYTEKFYNSLYDNVNSYGLTYGKHREYLEFNLSLNCFSNLSVSFAAPTHLDLNTFSTAFASSSPSEFENI